MSEQGSLEEALIVSIAGVNLDAGLELAEVGLDQLLKDGILREIPALSLLTSIWRTFGLISDRIFTGKVIRFLTKLSEVPLHEREAFVRKHEQPTERRDLGETLILLLDRLDDMGKPEALARIFSAYMREQINLETFRALAMALDRLPLSTLPHLRAFYRASDSLEPRASLAGEYHAQFAFAGLATIVFQRTGPTGRAGGLYEKTEYGELFLEILLPNWRD